MSQQELVWGLHAARQLLRSAPESVIEVWLDTRADQPELRALMAELNALGVAVQRVPRHTLDAMTDSGRHQGLVIRRKAMSAVHFDDLCAQLKVASMPTTVLVLDGVQDPQNLGSCLRIADAAGAIAVIVPKDRAVGFTGTVAKAASGAAETLPLVTVTNLARALDELKHCGLWIVGLTHDAPGSIYTADLTPSCALVLGGESRGLRRLTREHCDLLVGIPMRGTVESLNVAAAAAVALFETARQRACAENGVR